MDQDTDHTPIYNNLVPFVTLVMHHHDGLQFHKSAIFATKSLTACYSLLVLQTERK
jgi:hypothetical protein